MANEGYDPTLIDATPAEPKPTYPAPAKTSPKADRPLSDSSIERDLQLDNSRSARFLRKYYNHQEIINDARSTLEYDVILKAVEKIDDDLHTRRWARDWDKRDLCTIAIAIRAEDTPQERIEKDNLAITLALGIESKDMREYALIDIIDHFGASGDVERVKWLAQEIKTRWLRNRALESACEAAIETGKMQSAWKIAEFIKASPVRKIYAYLTGFAPDSDSAEMYREQALRALHDDTPDKSSS